MSNNLTQKMLSLLVHIILLFITFIKISKERPFKTSNILRYLEDQKEIYFIKADNLTFTPENKWQFYVQYFAEFTNTLEISTIYTLPILNNGTPSLISCIAESDSILSCSLEGQTQYTLIQLDSSENEEASIRWANLTKVYTIPQYAKLKYKRSYDLYLDPTYYWNFKIELLEKSLPENALVKVDVFYSSKNRIASCNYSYSILNCKIDGLSQSGYLVEFNPRKINGTIEWENLDPNKNISIALNITFTNFYFANDLKIIDNKWNFVFSASSQKNYEVNFFLKLKVKIKKNEDNINIENASCYSMGLLNYKCQVESDNAEENDLVFLTNLTDDMSAKWKNFIINDEQIIRPMELNFVKAYDLEFINQKWNFKIEISDELVQDVKISVDILYGDSRNQDEAHCIYQSKILYCIRKSNSQYNNEIIILTGIKNKGSTIWNNMKFQELKIPLITKLKYIKSYGLFFADKWNFMIDAYYINIIPKYSKAIIDILHNSEETTATCEIIGCQRKITNISCVSDFESQSNNDVIQINPNKTYGSIEWEPALSESDNKEIEIPEYKKIEINFIDAYDMEFSNSKWVFTIKGKFSSNIVANPGGKYFIDILYIPSANEEKIDSKATCLLTEGMASYTNILFKCVSDYIGQTKNDLLLVKYPQTSIANITWTGGISDNYPITLKTYLTLVKGYNLYYDKAWNFNMEVKDGILPKGSKVIVDVIKNTYLYTANCTALNNTCLLCNSTFSTTSNDYIYYTYYKSIKSSVQWTKILDTDYNFYLNTNYYFYSAFGLIFNNTINKWNFYIYISGGVSNSKTVIDVLYDDLPSTATCYQNRVLLFCTLDKEDQNNKALIKLSDKKTDYSTVTWKNIKSDEFIVLQTELTFSKAGNLRMSPRDNKTWIFDVYVTDENIPENSKIIIDLSYLSYSTIMHNDIIKYGNSTATCFFKNKILDCEASSDLKGIEYSISIKTTKTVNSGSNVTKWNNIDKEKIPIILVTEIGYNYCTKIMYVDNKYIFYCEILSNSKIPKGSEFIIDILIGDKPSTSYCIAQNNTNFKCEIKNEDFTTPNIYISKTKTSESTITWYNLYTDQYLYPIQLEYIFAYDGYSVSQSYYTFKILASGEKLKSRIRFAVKMMHKIDAKYGETRYDYVEYIPCEYISGILFCWWLNSWSKIITWEDIFYLILDETGELIEWKNPGNITIEETNAYRLTYEKLNFIGYNQAKKYYEFSLNAKGNYNSSSILIIDLYLGDINIYAFCVSGSNNNEINCHTPEVEMTPIDVIKIKREKYLGNVNWASLTSDIQICCDNNYFLIKISKIFDLHFNTNNKWEFKIKPLDNIEFEDTQTLDILIDTNPGFANCGTSNGLLNCEVDSDTQVNTQLIRLFHNTNYDGKIQILSLNNYGIPFNINLEYLKSYDLKYDGNNEYWSFTVNVKKTDNLIIPIDSTFSIDIKYEDLEGELAFCTKIKEIDENTITLLCKPQNKVESNSLILLNNIKSLYSSITWLNTITDESIIITTEINVAKVDNLQYVPDGSKWSFEMIISGPDLPLNVKVKIDLIYNEKETTATCILTQKNKFVCNPDEENQKKEDTFEISPIKKLGSVTYINDPNNLKFSKDKETEENIIEKYLEFEKAYDLEFNQKWGFKVNLSESNIQDNNIFIDIIVDGSDCLAYCSLDNNLLICEVMYEEQNIFNEIQLKNNKQNKLFKWINLPDVLDLYMSYEMKFINAYGGFHDNKWKFNIYHKSINQFQKIYDKNVLLDILVNDQESTALCEITFSSFLKCVSNHKNQKINDDIKIAGNVNPNLGTVYFSESLTDEQKVIKPINLYINYDSSIGYISNNKFRFDIKGSLAESIKYEIEEGTITEIEVLINKDGQDFSKDVICLTNNINAIKGSYVFLVCEINKKLPENEKVTIYTDEEGKSKYVKFNPKGSIRVNKINNEIDENNQDIYNDIDDKEDRESIPVSSTSLYLEKLLIILVLVFL